MKVGMGSWDGLTDFEIEAEHPGSTDGLQRHDWFFHSPDGETYGAFVQRLQAALESIRTAPGDCVVVSHAVTGRVLRGLHLNLLRDDALKLDAPQNVIFEFRVGSIERHQCHVAS